MAALVCLLILSPALFTPWGFGPDYTNHLWLTWQQSLAISDTGHPTLFLQSTGPVFEPTYGFYGGTLYAAVGGVMAIFSGHPYAVYVASIGAAIALAYGGTWWLGRQLGLSRWVAHLPGVVLVTGAYYLTDVYARGAWPEFVALSAVPMFLAGGSRLLTRSWRAGPVTLFVVATVVLTGSHNITLFWSATLIAPFALAAWVGAGRARPPLRRVAAVAGVAALALGINAWFLAVDVLHSGDTLIGVSPVFDWSFTGYFNNLAVILDPFRRTPPESGTYGLTPAAPVVAFGFSLLLTALAWPRLRRAGGAIRALWLILLVAIGVIGVMMIMPGSWWEALGSPFILIQFPYRLAGYLLIAIVVLLAVSLRFARDLRGGRRRIAVGLGIALAALSLAQASAQLYTKDRLNKDLNENVDPRRAAFAKGPNAVPRTYYSLPIYADASRPLVEVAPRRTLVFPPPSPGQTRVEMEVPLPAKPGSIATNVAAGPYLVRVEGMKPIGRTPEGMLVVEPRRPNAKTGRLVVVADGGAAQTIAGIVSILCILAVLGLVIGLTVRTRLRYRRGPAKVPMRALRASNRLD